jgi:hypothetical protein
MMHVLLLLAVGTLLGAVWLVVEGRRAPAEPYEVRQGPAVPVVFTAAQADAVDDLLWAARTSHDAGFTDAERGVLGAAWQRLRTARRIADEVARPQTNQPNTAGVLLVGQGDFAAAWWQQADTDR